jgi:methylenetetrahydrofolate dehydrogenase (NADP+)/methenyltetrahydrofolate cyclohydrolase/formyltetrahydrofolate synthetase
MAVPSDIEISQSCTPVPITEIATEAGILPDELSPFGRTKAKVSLDVLKRLEGQ